MAPRPGFGPGSGYEFSRDVLRATAAYTRPDYTTWAAIFADGLSAASLHSNLTN